MDVRKNIYALDDKELAKFRDAVNAIKTSGLYDTYAHRHHAAAMNPSLMTGETALVTRRNSAHRGPVFGPWHRQFIRDFELALQDAADKSVTLPYWDWAEDAKLADPRTAPLWSDAYIGGDGVEIVGALMNDPANFRVVDGPFKDWVVLIEDSTGALVPRPLPGLRRFLGRRTGLGALPTAGAVTGVLGETVYDSSPWRESSAPGFRDRLERVHDTPHVWVGGDMMMATSPNDPVFFLHHCNIDRLWAQWQAMHEDPPYVPAGDGPPGHNLDDEMRDLGTSGITPASVLDIASLDYSYS